MQNIFTRKLDQCPSVFSIKILPISVWTLGHRVGETSTDNLQIWLLLVDEDDESQNKMMLSENPDVEEFSGEQHSLSYLKSSFAF